MSAYASTPAPPELFPDLIHDNADLTAGAAFLLVDLTITTLKLKHFIRILIIVVASEYSEILKFLFEFKSISNSDLNLKFNSNSIVIQSK
jgi:hypothetical protein